MHDHGAVHGVSAREKGRRLLIHEAVHICSEVGDRLYRLLDISHWTLSNTHHGTRRHIVHGQGQDSCQVVHVPSRW